MAILYALILGVVQGLTEFLPISSSGHLMIFESLFGLSGNMFFNVLVHFATLIAVVLVLWKDVAWMVRHPFSSQTLSVLLASVPTAIIALVINHFVSEVAMAAFLGFGFFISFLIITTTMFLQKRKNKIPQPMTYKKALVVGLVQGVAVLPGISRSGSTICASLLMGVEREESAKFSFLISLPVIVGSMLFEVADAAKFGFGNFDIWFCLTGFVAAFVVAIFTIKLMLKIVKKGSWWGFSAYLFVLSVVILLNQFVFGWF